MKNILVPTDFSTCATHAMDLGIALAEFFGATIHFFTCMESTNGETILDCQLVEGNAAQKEYFRQTDILFQKWKNEAAVRKVQVNSVCSSGSLVAAIQEYVKNNNIDFVVMGSHGRSGWNKFMMGSNTQKVVRALHVPVFILKKAVQQYEFKKVIYASDFSMEEKSSFAQFLNFIKKFRPDVIHLLGINTSDRPTPITENMQTSMKEFKAMCNFSTCEEHVYSDKFVEAGIRHFAKDIGADLVVISNHNRHPIKRIFSGSNVEAVVHNCELPVLSIDFSDKIVFNQKEGILNQEAR